MARKAQITISNNQASQSKKILWMVVILLIIIAVIGTSIDLTGNSTRMRQLKVAAQEPTPQTLSYTQLEKMLPNMFGREITITSGRLSTTGKFLATRQQTFDTTTPEGRKALQNTLTQQEAAGYTFQITTGTRSYIVIQ
ncbi:MAG: hypothetical protein Q7R96_01510 [Nanoarchaeota archaeon]|nr:hypothetical protein [Nanoarchaeota archaeon]